MERTSKERPDRRLLDDLPEVHDRDFIARFLDQPKVVGDVQHRDVAVGLQLPDQRDNLLLQLRIEGRRGLIGDEHAWLSTEGQCNSDPLAHAPRELVHVLAQSPSRLREADPFKKVGGYMIGFPSPNQSVQPDRLAQLCSDRPNRRKTLRRVLEYHADLPTADASHRRAVRIKRRHIHRCLSICVVVQRDVRSPHLTRWWN